jgi:hypothetical protein
MAGVHFCRVRAGRYFSRRTAFTREKMLTAGVYYGNCEANPQPDAGKELCRVLRCIFEDHGVFTPASKRRISEWWFDVKRFVECVKEACREFNAKKCQASIIKCSRAFSRSRSSRRN